MNKEKEILKITPENIHYYIRNKSPVNRRKKDQPQSKTDKMSKDHKFFGLDENRYEMYRIIFNTFSSNGKYLTVGELRNIFNYLGIYTNQNEIFNVLCDYDMNETGYIDFEEFLNVITDRTKPFEKETKRKNIEIFNQLSNRKKTITADDFEKCFFKHGFDVTKEEILEIYNFLLKKVNEYDGLGNEQEIDMETFNKLILQVTQELKKHIKANQF